jgi:DNA-binding NarL/FixJ family response regulator
MFTEGIATRLRQHLDQIDLQVVDSQGPMCLANIHQARPGVIMLKADDQTITSFCLLERLLEAAPDAKVIRLDGDLNRSM